MGAALERLSRNERDRIARSVLTGCDDRNTVKIGAHCPFHKESTPGGAFYYDPDRDFAFCHSCRTSGDLIDVYAVANGYSPDDPEAFRAFWRDFAPDKLRKGGGKGGASARGPAGDGLSPAEEQGACREDPDRWTPTPVIMPPGLWQQKCGDFMVECAEHLHGNAAMRDLLQSKWGVSPQTVQKNWIGYNPKEMFKAQKSWGLPDEKNENGRDRCIHLPRGFVFPVLDSSGTALLRMKIRLEEPGDNDPSYKAVRGGSTNCYGIWGNALEDKIWVVVETERDAVYLRQQLGRYGIGAMGVGTAGLAPDAAAHGILNRADAVINALDNDRAGALASWRFAENLRRFSWNRTYPHCIRWPVPRRIGKDAGDLHGKLDAWQWIAAALPATLVLRCERRAARNERKTEVSHV